MSRTSNEDTRINKHPGFKSESPPLDTTTGMLVTTLFLPDPLPTEAAAAAAALAASSAFASCWVLHGSLPKGHQEGDSSSDKSLQDGENIKLSCFYCNSVITWHMWISRLQRRIQAKYHPFRKNLDNYLSATPRSESIFSSPSIMLSNCSPWWLRTLPVSSNLLWAPATRLISSLPFEHWDSSPLVSELGDKRCSLQKCSNTL